MTSLLGVAAIGYFGYRFARRAPRLRRSMPARAEYQRNAPPATRAMIRGEAGEAAVRAELRRVLAGLCGNDFYLHDGAVLVQHAPGTAFPTAEIDHIAVTPFGIFVIETKNWSGQIAPAANADDVVRTGADGVAEVRRSPLAQNRTKVAFLNRKLPPVWPIEGLGVFAAADCTLHPGLPLPLIHINELALWLRLRRSDFGTARKKPVNVRVAWEAIMLNASTCDFEIDEHRKRLRTHAKDHANDAV
ncbi:nuclease-related domain-containing protein [Paraburkholderia tropica]|uniref:nuclease-related domain-containing protein n=1 Tax=Paraburkholderia tropica TaxID=92647 RepID=UPI001619676A|nr:nuclease-related domain-containing protein [Paraburkholderia tropica]